MRSRDSSYGVEMCAELLVGIEVTAFANKMEIEVGEEEREGVGIEDFEGLPEVRAALNLIAAGFWSGGLIGRPDSFEEAFRAEFYSVGDFCRGNNRILEDDAGFGGLGKEKTDGPAGGDRMRAEDAKGIGVISGEKSIGARVEIGAGLPFRPRSGSDG